MLSQQTARQLLLLCKHRKSLSRQVFFAQQHGYNSVFLEWNNPATNFGQLTYFAPDDAQLETFGLSYANLSYETAIAFDAVTLSAYKGQKLTSVGFYPMEAQGGWTINLYTRDAAASFRSSTHSPSRNS